MSGSGKTTIGRALKEEVRKKSSNTVLVDGDEIREIFGSNNRVTSYTRPARRENAERIVEICKWLDRQNIHVICCILCIFPDILDMNRQRFGEYFEISIEVPLDVLIERDDKGIYKRGLNGVEPNVVGIDIPYPTPRSPDYIIKNNFSLVIPQQEARKIVLHPSVGQLHES